MSRMFDSVVGHKNEMDALNYAIAKQRLHPVQLFVGPSGIGKKRIAVAVAQALLCEQSPNGCGSCSSCSRISKGFESSKGQIFQTESLYMIAPEGTQIKVEQTRAVQNWLSLKSLRKKRVVLIEDADKMNPQAANSLLKTLEEPPEETFFILLARSLNSVLSTIRSRSQIMRFASLTHAEVKHIHPASDWAIVSSQGQLDRLAQLATPEYDELRKNTLRLFISTAHPEHRPWAFAQIKESATDREVSLQMISLWSQFVRDLAMINLSSSEIAIIHADRKSDFNQFNTILPEHVEALYELVSSAERDLLSYVDRTVVFENLWLKTMHSLNPTE